MTLKSVSLAATHATEYGDVLEIEARGVVQPGSAGNPTARELADACVALAVHERCDAILFDFHALKYTFGDSVLAVAWALVDHTTMSLRPGGILANPRSASQFRELLACSNIPYLGVFETRANALNVLAGWIAQERRDRETSREFRRRLFEAVLRVLRIRGPLPNWHSGDRDEVIGAPWCVSFRSGDHQYTVRIGDLGAEVAVDAERCIRECGDDQEMEDSVIADIVRILSSCLSGEDPAVAFKSLETGS
jgi:hypothetical protein